MRNKAIAQMPQIACPHPFGPTAVDELAKDSLDAIAHAAKDRTPAMQGRMFGRAKGREQDNATLAQAGFEVRQPVIAISQQQALGVSGQIVIGWLAFMQIGRS